MDYKLAKQLKEAGFPQNGDGYGLFEDGDKINVSFIGSGNIPSVYVPTLSELIEACGDIIETKIRITNDEHKIEYNNKLFFHLRKIYNGVSENNQCVASFENTDIPQNSWKIGRGLNYEEAVSRLWLELKVSS